MSDEQPETPATPDRARSFGAVAEAYDRGRPTYPAEAAAWLVGGEAKVVLELAAGTGKLTRDVFGKIIPMMTMNPANYEMLEKMAKIGKGRFYRALDRDQLQRVYEEIDRLERTEVKIRETVTYESHRQAWMLAALVLLLAELLGAFVRPRAP